MIQLTNNQLNEIFPFFFEVNNDLEIKNYGKSFAKLISKKELNFNNDFFIHRPFFQQISFEILKQEASQIFIIELVRENMILRGQFISSKDNCSIIFIGSPYIQSLEQLKEKEFNINDFAPHDATFDFLNLVDNIENQGKEINKLHQQLVFTSKKLEQSEADYKMTLESASDIIFTCDIEGYFIYSNPAGEKISEYNLEELKKIRYIDLVRKDYKQKTANHYFNQIENKIPSSYFEFPLISKSGKEKWIGQSVQIRKEDGKFQLAALAIDITRQKKSEFALKSTKQKLESILNEMTDVIWSVGLPDMEGLFITKSFTNLYELSVEEWISNPKIVETLIVDEDKWIFEKIYLDARNFGYFSETYRIKTKSGAIKWITNRGKIVLDKHGNRVRIDGSTIDNTKQYLAEEKFNNEIKLQEILIDIASTYINIDLKNVKKAIKDSLKKVSLFIGADAAYIFENNRRIFEKKHAWYLETTDLESTDILPVTLSKNLFQKHIEGEFVHIQNHDTLDLDELELKTHLVETGIESIISVPIFNKGELIIILGFNKKNGSLAYTSREKNLLNLFGQMILGIQMRIEKEHLLYKQEEKFRNIISNMNLGLVEVDNYDNIIFANQSFCEMSGYTHKELKGKNVDELLLTEDSKKIIAENILKRAQGISDSCEIELFNKNGDRKWWFLSGAPNYNDKGELIGSIGINLDITDQKTLEKELAEAKNIAEKAAKAKESFLANMSHEIRTPLNVIIGVIRQMRKEDLSDKQAFYVKQSESSANHLLTILNNILDIAKIESGEMEVINDQSVNLTAIANNVQSILYSQANEKNLNFSTTVSPDIHMALMGDEIRLRQVLINLIGNSIKFTQEGKVSLNLSILSKDENTQTIRFVVEDTGIGMSESFILRIFDKFSQEQTTANRKFEGTGLGMAISNDLINMMGGKLNVESQKNIGTTFTFDIPFVKGNLDNKTIELNSIRDDAFKGYKILLVEDNEMNRLIASLSLSILKVDITEAENGLIALEKLKNETFDLILMDIQMPEMDGIEATQEIRNTLKLKTPIIAMTANAFKHDIDLYLSIGMNDYITKPYDEDELLTKIGNTLNASKKVETKEIIEIQTENDLYDLSYIKKISKGNTVFVEKMTKIFIELIEVSIPNLEKAIKNGDVDTIKKITHKIKPSSIQMGIQGIHEPIKKIELYAVDDMNINLEKWVKEITECLREVLVEIKKEKNF